MTEKFWLFCWWFMFIMLVVYPLCHWLLTEVVKTWKHTTGRR